MNDFTDYASLGQTGFENKEPVKPEDELFHSLYICGVTRPNHINVQEEAGKMQIRGVEYNLDTVNCVIMHVKKVLQKNGKDASGKDITACFSYKKDAPPWYGYDNRKCGTNSAERAADAFCKDCREQIIVSAIYCDQMGNPVTHPETGKPLFLFFRGKGMKYSNVADYLGEMYKMEIEPLFQPATEQSLDFEKIAVNNKRHVTVIGMAKVPSNFGEKDVFTLTKGTPIANENVMSILKIAKETQDKFNKKMDWSKVAGAGAAGATSYAPATEQAPVDQSNVIPDANQQQAAPQTGATTQQPASQPAAQPEQPAQQKTFNFEDIQF